MRSEGLEYSEYLYVQRETRKSGEEGERGQCRARGGRCTFTILFEGEGGRSGEGCTESRRWGVLWKDLGPRESAPHQIQGFSVLDRNEREDMGGRE